MPKIINRNQIKDIPKDLSTVIDDSVKNDTFNILSESFLSEPTINHELELTSDQEFILECFNLIKIRMQIANLLDKDFIENLDAKINSFSKMEGFLKKLSKDDIQLIISLITHLQEDEIDEAKEDEMKLSIGVENWLVGVYRTGHHTSSERCELNPEKIEHKAKDEDSRSSLKLINLMVKVYESL